MQCHFGQLVRLAGVYVCILNAAAASFAASKPNIIMILSDDAAYRDFGFSAALTNGTTQNQTPNLDALAQSGLIASQMYSAQTVCSTARAGLLAGLHPQKFGYEDNINETDPNSTQGLVPEQVTIAQRLKSLGYSTGMVGKWHLGNLQGYNRPLDKGFDEFFGLIGGSRDYAYDANFGRAIWKDNQYYENQYRTEGDVSKYDPVRGRYVTDAFGEEAVSFINRHAGEENPFFLYLSMTAPHTPYQAKQVDLDRFSHISDPERRTIAAMVYAMDRSIGEVMGSLAANNIDEDTIVIFANDQGSPSWRLNPPFKGFKGTLWEGAIRVPFTIKGPGIQPGVYDSPLTFYDILPTLVSAGGGDISEFEHDGYDVMRNLKGETTDDPHEVLYWRGFDAFAVRKGDWKLTKPIVNNPDFISWLFNIKTDPGENVFVQAAHPDIVADLTRELTAWETTLAKPKWGGLGTQNQNEFDHFVFRGDVASTSNWSAASNWKQAGTNNNATLKRADAYANAILEFGVRNDADYTATNDMKRMSNTTFMLNQLKFTGDFNGLASRQALINGNALLFVKNLSGQSPRITLGATASAGSPSYTFRLDNELQLFHDLEITGDGTQTFVIGGNIRDYYEPQQPNITTPHSVRKTGTSKVTLRGNNSFAGSLIVAGGEVALAGSTAAINGASSILVQSGATFNLQEGLVKTPELSVHPNGAFAVNGGRLETRTVFGDLIVNQGTFAPGLSIAVSTISDTFALNGGRLQIDLGGANPGTGFDQLQVGGTAIIAGGLQVQLAPGFTPVLYQSFEILTAAELIGTFSSYSLPALPGGMGWRAVYTTSGISLSVRPPGDTNTTFSTGDYNFNGVVDAGDYTVWRNTLGSTTDFSADGNGDHVIDQLDYDVWKTHRGQVFSGMAGDFNLNGAVDYDDYNIWVKSLESTVAVADFNTWRQNLLISLANGGASYEGASITGNVPELNCLVIALIGILVGTFDNDLARRMRKHGNRTLDPALLAQQPPNQESDRKSS
jgi:autotransporter-associated beta strand protein